MKVPQIRSAEGAFAEEASPNSIPGRRRVAGGKALARLLFFQEQRGFSREALYDGQPDFAVAKVESSDLIGSSRQPNLLGTADIAPTGLGVSPYLQAYEALSFSGSTAGPALAAPSGAPVPPRWHALGPCSIPHGQTYGDGPGSRPPVSGRISAVAVDPINPAHLLIGAAGGGIWESSDGGSAWEPRADDMPSLSIGALSFDPSNPRIVYAGTGEGNSFSWLGVGLLRSDDGGSTWALHAKSPFQGISFYDLVVDPADGDHLLAATSEGLYESSDGGLVWHRRRSVTTWSLSIQPGGGPGGEVLAACSDGIYRSPDGGTNWNPVTVSGLPTDLQRAAVCHAPSNGAVAYVAAAGSPLIPDPTDSKNPLMPTPYLGRRNTSSGAFVSFPVPPDLQTGQASYDWFAAVSPADENVLYLGAIAVHRGERTAAGWRWENLSARASGTSIHPDQHVIAFSPFDPQVLYVGNDGGLYTSADEGSSWRSLNRGLEITEFEFLAQHPQVDAWLIAGTQDNGTLRFEGNGLWFHVQDGDGGDCGFSATAPEHCFHTFYGMGMEISAAGGAWNSWSWVGPDVPDAENYRAGALFYPPVEVFGTVVAQAGKSVFISRSLGNHGSWQRVPLPASAGRTSALAFSGPDRILAGTERGKIFRLEFIGGAWQKQALASPTPHFLSDLLIDPTNPDRLWATSSDLHAPGIFRSDDGGTTWHDLSASFPVTIPLNAVEIDPANPNTVFVAADVGVYRSVDAGATWTPLVDGLPNALVNDLVLHPVSRVLRAATQSRGVWEIQVDAASEPDFQIFLRDNPIDRARKVPSASFGANPFEPGRTFDWRSSPDLKVDRQPFTGGALGNVDYVVFGDDRDMSFNGHQFRAGLLHETAQRGARVRIYVQIHRRGRTAGQNVLVKVFWAGADSGIPELDANFWTNFPDVAPASGAVWQQVAAALRWPSLDPGSPVVAELEWDVPSGAPQQIALLALISADNDALSTTVTRVEDLVRGEVKCSLRIVDVQP
jgi:photosystem II stability/assembly factor-like uncharacterized protein